MTNKILVILGAVAIIATVLSFDYGSDFIADYNIEEVKRFHQLKSGDGEGLIFETNDLFASSGECVGCHGLDPLGNASVTANGNDINLIDDWRSTMMANAAKDPFWKAKVNHETLVYPQHKDAIESSCTDCHAPLGYFNAIHNGLDQYTMADLEADSIAKDGVSCAACHQQMPDSAGHHISGEMYFQETNLYGPYTNPFGGPMESFVGFAPVYDEFITKSEACAACHTLGTETIDYDGVITENLFIEQATYHEWLNSNYNNSTKVGQQCQDCHMPAVNEDVVIAANLLFLPPRNPFYLHEFVGANVFMLNMLKDNLDTLHVSASSAQMDSSINKTLNMLQNNALEIEITQLSRDDSTEVLVEITNKAGHKFPSGYPSRLAFVELLGVNPATGDTLFASGLMDENHDIINRDENYEPHYDYINSEEQVQIYEMVMGDVNGDVTTVLTRAKEPIKDNRLVPFGFSTNHISYDTTLMAGLVLADDNFNLDEQGFEGTGKDNIRYKFFTGDINTVIQITAKVYYQSIPARWLESMFEYSSDQIDFFGEMYAAADHTPIFIVADTLMSGLVGVDEVVEEDYSWFVYPNPSRDGKVSIQAEGGISFERVDVYDAAGRLVESMSNLRHHRLDIQLPDSKGYYFITLRWKDGVEVKQVLRL